MNKPYYKIGDITYKKVNDDKLTAKSPKGFDIVIKFSSKESDENAVDQINNILVKNLFK